MYTNTIQFKDYKATFYKKNIFEENIISKVDNIVFLSTQYIIYCNILR